MPSATDTPPAALTVFGREPAVYVGLVQSLVAVLLAVHIINVSAEQAGLIVALAAAVGGIYTAFAVKNTMLSAAVTLSKVAIALAVAFGLNLAADQVGVIMTFVTLALSYLLRTQTSPAVDDYVPADDEPDPAAG